MSRKARDMTRLAALMEARFMAEQSELRARLAVEARVKASLDGLDEARAQAMTDAADPASFSPALARATGAWLRWTDGRKAALNGDLARAHVATAAARKGLSRSFGQMQASQKLSEDK